MKKFRQLGKASEIIGYILFYLLVVVSVIVAISFNLSNLENEPETSIIIGAILGSLLAIILIYFLWKLLLRPIYSFNKTIKLKMSDQISAKAFKNKWVISLICSGIFGVLFIIGTFGISLLLMLPHYVLLAKTKNI